MDELEALGVVRSAEVMATPIDKAAYRERAKAILAMAAPRAAEVLVQHMESEDGQVAVRAAGTVLNRMGVVELTVAQVMSAETVMTFVEVLKEVERRRLERLPRVIEGGVGA